MSPVRKTTVCALCLAATLMIANVVQAQSRPATPSAPAPLGALAPPSAGPNALFASWDKDHNKLLSLDEFKAGWQAALMLRQLRENFIAKDINKNGSLDAAEYANLDLIKQAGKSAPPMSAFDSDKSQSLDFKEYVGMVNAMLKNQR